MREKFRPGAPLAAALAGAAAATGFLVWAPTAVGFAFAVIASFAWCFWLERHPEA